MEYVSPSIRDTEMFYISGFYAYLFIYLKVELTEGNDKEKSPVCWFTTQLATMSSAVPGDSQELVASLRPQRAGPSLTAFPRSFTRELDWK